MKALRQREADGVVARPASLNKPDQLVSGTHGPFAGIIGEFIASNTHASMEQAGLDQDFVSGYRKPEPLITRN